MKLRIFFLHHTSNTVYIHIRGKERTFCQRDAVKCVENKLVNENNATMTYHGNWSHKHRGKTSTHAQG